MSYSKYKNVKVELDGHIFDSKKEAQRYAELRLLQRGNVIKDLVLQVPFVLIDKTKYGQKVRYIADFCYTDIAKNCTVVEDVKGVKTPVYKLKKRLMQERYGITIEEI